MPFVIRYIYKNNHIISTYCFFQDLQSKFGNIINVFYLFVHSSSFIYMPSYANWHLCLSIKMYLKLHSLPWEKWPWTWKFQNVPRGTICRNPVRLTNRLVLNIYSPARNCNNHIIIFKINFFIHYSSKIIGQQILQNL